MFTTLTNPPPARLPTAARPDDNPWLLWRPDGPAEPVRLSVAELAECRCPELCDRDHDND